MEVSIIKFYYVVFILVFFDNSFVQYHSFLISFFINIKNNKVGIAIKDS